jgi:hypothetical protein
MCHYLIVKSPLKSRSVGEVPSQVAFFITRMYLGINCLCHTYMYVVYIHTLCHTYVLLVLQKVQNFESSDSKNN